MKWLAVKMKICKYQKKFAISKTAKKMKEYEE
jgi:hypothetical protein